MDTFDNSLKSSKVFSQKTLVVQYPEKRKASYRLT